MLSLYPAAYRLVYLQLEQDPLGSIFPQEWLCLQKFENIFY